MLHQELDTQTILHMWDTHVHAQAMPCIQLGTLRVVYCTVGWRH